MDGRETYHKLLHERKEEVLAMGSMVEKAMGRSVEALKKRDLSLGHQIIADDARIDEKRFEIEKKTIELIATQQPSATELNAEVAILNIINELERIGDYAAGIAKIVIMIGDEPPLKPLIDIPRMSDITVEMIHNSLKSFIENDSKAAIQVIGMDEVVDSMYDQIFRELLTFMMTDPKTINRATRLIWVAHNIERAADRATNICERVVYTVTGKMEEIGASKY
ncbi:MAG TPA: phosphate signaling complex protein PhoU [Dehalococcoidales bacterium]